MTTNVYVLDDGRIRVTSCWGTDEIYNCSSEVPLQHRMSPGWDEIKAESRAKKIEAMLKYKPK